MYRIGRLSIEVDIQKRGARLRATVEDPKATATGIFLFARVEGVLRLQGIELRSLGDELRVTEVRKSLPLGEWEEAARFATVQALEDRPIMKEVKVSEISLRRSRPRKETPPYEKVSQRYSELTSAGIKNPAAVIAGEFGITGTTARNWLRRARQLQILAEAPMPGVAGEIRAVRVRPPTLRFVEPPKKER